MRIAASVTVVGLILMAADPAGAISLCPQPWCRKAEAVVQRWLGGAIRRDPEIIRPPAGIDPQMALTPPEPRGVLRVIPPRGGSGTQ